MAKRKAKKAKMNENKIAGAEKSADGGSRNKIKAKLV